MSSRWRDDWQSATVINSSLVDDPTVRLPGFHLLRRQWSFLSRFWTGQGHSATSACVEIKQMRSYRQWNMCLRRHPDIVTYHLFLPANKTRLWSTTSTHCRQSCCWLADIICFLEAYETLHQLPYGITFRHNTVTMLFSRYRSMWYHIFQIFSHLFRKISENSHITINLSELITKFGDNMFACSKPLSQHSVPESRNVHCFTRL